MKKCTKVPYMFLGEAAYHAKILHQHRNHNKLNIYKCDKCGAFHLTSRNT